MRPVVLLALLTSLLAAAPARADGRGDGLYGRFDSAMQLAIGAGGAFTRSEGQTTGSAIGELRLRILGAGGPVLAGVGPNAPSRLFAGIELRPLFPALFLQTMSTGHEWLDIFLQSLGFELGAGFALDGHGHVGLAWGVAIEVPLVLPSRFAEGIYLRLGARHVNASPSYQLTSDTRDRSEWTGYATLVIQLGLGSRNASWEPPRFR